MMTRGKGPDSQPTSDNMHQRQRQNKGNIGIG